MGLSGAIYYTDADWQSPVLVFLGLLAYTIYSITQGRKFPLPLLVIPFGLLTTFILSPGLAPLSLSLGYFFSSKG